MTVSEPTRQYALTLALPASPKATAGCITAFGTTDFRDDLAKVDVPTLVIHGDSDGVVPFEASGKRTAEAVKGAELHVIKGGPHGINASHAQEFNDTLIAFLAK
jgi:non-heme chloroperoxidase